MSKATIESMQRVYADLLRVQKAVASGDHSNIVVAGVEEAVESLKSVLFDLGAAVPCKLCRRKTVGAVGVAGIFLPFLCQSCKNSEDAAARERTRTIAAVMPLVLSGPGGEFRSGYTPEVKP